MIHAPPDAIGRARLVRITQVRVACQLPQRSEQRPLHENDPGGVLQRARPTGVENAQRPVATVHVPAAGDRQLDRI